MFEIPVKGGLRAFMLALKSEKSRFFEQFLDFSDPRVYKKLDLMRVGCVFDAKFRVFFKITW